jgi:hypothetical protein
VDQHAYWVPPGEALTVAGYSMPGGMMYCGFGLTAPRGGIEPALIDIALPIDRAHPDWQGHELPYWPSYAGITPGARAAYLAWLADGRRFRSAPIAYVRLFFYGLERRVLRDLPGDDAARRELPAIREEVSRLLSVYGRHRAFHTTARSFLDVLDLMEHTPGPPALGTGLALRLGLGWYAATGLPLPVHWAEAWAYPGATTVPGSNGMSGAEAAGSLFRSRYAKRFGTGFVIPSGTARVRIDYRTASPGIGEVTLTLDTPDVSAPPAPMRELVASVDNDLDAYRRWIALHPDGHGSLAEAALLPADLPSGRAGQVAVLRAWCEARLATGSPTVVNGADLVGFWPAADPARMTPSEAAGLARLLARLGVGLEPDVRMGGPALTAGPAVLFRLPTPTFAVPRPAYRLAAALVRLALAVGATPDLSDVDLSEAESDRLDAFRRWVTETGVDFPERAGLWDGIDDALRLRVAVVVGTAVGEKACALLGLEPADGVADLSVGSVLASIVGGLDRPSGTDAASGDGSGWSPGAGGRHRASDGAVRVAGPEGSIADPGGAVGAPGAGLDGPHRLFVAGLVRQAGWSLREVEDLARECRVLPAGAVDVVNEVALERTGDPALDGDDELTVHVAALEGLLG